MNESKGSMKSHRQRGNTTCDDHLSSGLFTILPENCIANVLSLTSPADACRCSLVSKTFLSAAEADVVWNRFLAPFYHQLLPGAVTELTLTKFSSAKEHFFYLCENPLLIDNGNMSYSLEKRSGKTCYMLSARSLTIARGDNWNWTSLLPTESRFAEVAALEESGRLDIRGIINVSMLSPMTVYAAYLVFKLTNDATGFHIFPSTTFIGFVGKKQRRVSNACLDCRRWYQMWCQMSSIRYPKRRNDGWWEVELGCFFNNCSNFRIRKTKTKSTHLEVGLFDDPESHVYKTGLIVQGIEMRPKNVSVAYFFTNLT